MVRVRDLKLGLRAFMLTYRWRVIDPVQPARLGRPVQDARIALVSSAGLVVPGDEPFDAKVKGGDFSHRVVQDGVDLQSLEDHHRSDAFDHRGIAADPNMALPLDRLHELASAGEIGSVAPRHISLMGSITAPGRLIRRTLPAVAEILVEDSVDIALMVPVCPVCHQTVSLAQAEIENRGIPTASLTMLPEITRKLRPPRALEVPFGLGFPLGAPNDPEGQRAVLRALLALVDRQDVPVLEAYLMP